MQITINKKAANELLKAIAFFVAVAQDTKLSKKENTFVGDQERMKILDTNTRSLYELVKVSDKIRKKLNQ